MSRASLLKRLGRLEQMMEPSPRSPWKRSFGQAFAGVYGDPGDDQDPEKVALYDSWEWFRQGMIEAYGEDPGPKRPMMQGFMRKRR